MISIALNNILYFWSNKQKDNNVHKVSELQDDCFYCSLKWNPGGSMIGTGSNQGVLDIIDSQKFEPLWTQVVHSSRISSMSWMSEYIVSTGSRDNSIKTFDLRTPTNTVVLLKHSQEVCGLKWSPNGIHLASGGNDNTIHIWDHRR